MQYSTAWFLVLKGERRKAGGTHSGGMGMATANVVLENAIERALLDQWDPLGVRDQPGAHNEYARQAHEVFGMLLRGASDVQIARLLHRAEADEFQHPELVDRDLTPLVRELRRIEASLGPKVL